MALLTIDHDNDDTLILSQIGQHIVITAGQVDSVIKSLELAALELRQAKEARMRRMEFSVDVVDSNR